MNDNIIDSRDIIERIAELENELFSAYEDENTQLDFDDYIEMVLDDELHQLHIVAVELKEYCRLQDDCEHVPDWDYGEALIKEDHFVNYITELINDCYELPNIALNEWPYRHIKLNYEAAAQEARSDYSEVELFGQTYLIRG